MPSGGDGFYYFSVYLLVHNGEYSRFDIWINGEVLCTVDGDQVSIPADDGQVACAAAAYAVEG